MLRAPLLSLAFALTMLAPTLRAQNELPRQAKAVVEKYCYRCHGQDGSREGGLGYILDVPQLLERKRVVAKSPDKSRLYLRLTSTDETEVMPPREEKQRPGKDDLTIIRQWIDAGAPPFPEPEAIAVARPRTPVTLADSYQAMYQHLLKAERQGAARYQRFFTLAHLHNNPKIADAQLPLYRAGLAKALNSLSWRKAIVLPRPIDPAGTVLALDLRDLDWDLNYNWDRLVSAARDKSYKGYPYALTHDRYPEHEQLNIHAKEVYKLAGTQVPAVRADWFIANALRPPVYHELLHLPSHASELDRRQGADHRQRHLLHRLPQARHDRVDR